jgi:hypothetical protein
LRSLAQFVVVSARIRRSAAHCARSRCARAIGPRTTVVAVEAGAMLLK